MFSFHAPPLALWLETSFFFSNELTSLSHWSSSKLVLNSTISGAIKFSCLLKSISSKLVSSDRVTIQHQNTIFNSHCAFLLFGKTSNELRLQFNAKQSSSTKLHFLSVTFMSPVCPVFQTEEFLRLSLNLKVFFFMVKRVIIPNQNK